MRTTGCRATAILLASSLLSGCAPQLPVIIFQKAETGPITNHVGTALRPALEARLAQQPGDPTTQSRIAVQDSWVKRHILTEHLAIEPTLAYADHSTRVLTTPRIPGKTKLPPTPAHTLSPEQFSPDRLK